MFSDLAAVEAYLSSLINYESRLPLGGRDWPKLEPTQEAVSRSGLSLSLPNALHLAGTKGKGSTATFLEALLGPDAPTLSFTSPHLVSFIERVRLNGKPLPDHIWCDGFSEIVPRLQNSPAIKLTYFETTFIFYLWASRHLGTEVHVVEAGLGGRWDATNVLRNTTAILTLVDYDHTDILGRTLTDIATDKSGIVKPGSRVIIGRQPNEAMQVYERVAAQNSAKTFVFGRDYRWSGEGRSAFTYHEPDHAIADISLMTPGRHQWDNAATAIRAARMVRGRLRDEEIRTRLRNCVVPGRQELLPGTPPVLVDVAHNPASFAALADTLRIDFAGREVVAVAGLMKDKDARACFAHLTGMLSKVMVMPLNSPRSFDPVELSATLREMGFPAVRVDNREAAFETMHSGSGTGLGLVTGSFYLVGDYLIWRRRAGIA